MEARSAKDSTFADEESITAFSEDASAKIPTSRSFALLFHLEATARPVLYFKWKAIKRTLTASRAKRGKSGSGLCRVRNPFLCACPAPHIGQLSETL